MRQLMEGVLRFAEKVNHRKTAAPGEGWIVRDFLYDAEHIDKPSHFRNRPHPWAEWKPDGLIVNTVGNPRAAAWVKRTGLPIVNTTAAPTEFPCVHTSLSGLVRSVYDHFRLAGFAHFAYVSTWPEDNRKSHFQELLRCKGFELAVCTTLENPSYYDEETEKRVASDLNLTELLWRAPKPLAVHASSDHIARAVCIAAMNMELRIPQDVGVVGTGNFPAGRTFNPTISTITVPNEQVGFRAAEMLMKLIAGEPVPRVTEIPPGPVIARESTIAGPASIGDEIVAKAELLIRERACRGLTVAQLVEELSVSRKTLERSFAAQLGRTPGDEIVRIRLETAKQLLATTSLPVSRIALSVGYDSAANFTAFFRKNLAVTPGEFRKRAVAAS
jgi:LacI family transcriptional regulator